MRYGRAMVEDEEKENSSRIETPPNSVSLFLPSLPSLLSLPTDPNVRGHAIQDLLLHGQDIGQGPGHDHGPLVIGAGEGPLLLQNLHYHARRVQLTDKGTALRCKGDKERRAE